MADATITRNVQANLKKKRAEAARKKAAEAAKRARADAFNKAAKAKQAAAAKAKEQTLAQKQASLRSRQWTEKVQLDTWTLTRWKIKADW